MGGKELKHLTQRHTLCEGGISQGQGNGPCINGKAHAFQANSNRFSSWHHQLKGCQMGLETSLNSCYQTE